MTAYPKLAALAVVLKDDQVILVKRMNEPDAGLWGFPGGHVNLGETGLAAAERELYEETSVIAQPVRYLTNVDVVIRTHSGEIEFHFLLAAVLCHYVSGAPLPSDDAAEAQWVDISDVFEHQIKMSAHVEDVVHLAV